MLWEFFLQILEKKNIWREFVFPRLSPNPVLEAQTNMDLKREQNFSFIISPVQPVALFFFLRTYP